MAGNNGNGSKATGAKAQDNGNGNGNGRHPGGRPSSFKGEEHLIAVYLSAAEGATWEAIAERCGVNRQTVINWCDPKHGSYQPEFFDAVTLARAACNDARESSLHRRSMWTVVEDTNETIERVLPPSNKAAKERVAEFVDEDGLILKHTITTYRKTLPPDTNAIIFGLCNRDPKRWRSVQRIEVTGGGGGPISHVDATTLTREELERRATELVVEIEAVLASSDGGAGTG